MMQRTANENAACLRRICERSDQPKVERIANNDARLILSKKLNGATRSKQLSTVAILGFQFGLYLPPWDFRFCGFSQFLVRFLGFRFKNNGFSVLALCTVCGFSPILSLVFGFCQQ